MWAKKQIVYTCIKLLILQHTKEKFEDTKEVISQYNAKRKIDKKDKQLSTKHYTEKLW